jgi:hypothetical protein
VSEPTDADVSGAARDMSASVATISLVIGAVLVSIFSGRAADGTSERCVALLDRFVELRLLAADPKTTPLVVEEHQAEAREQARRSHALERCQRRLTQDSAACADRAHSADELERCFF